MSQLGYDYTLNSCCVAAGDDAGQLVAFLSRMAASPFTSGDYQESDNQGRQVEVVLHERWLISFWPDHAVKLLHVVDIQVVG